ncbi:hypothetical protein EVAR_49939_1 [Eumeta japonica]|uniref:Uncharacterized protein n=1 Tax=Eumeta variegata TaxID=151549 RepID=A0A4C1XWE0_EUMVA|nr:hypothetical protein EVAR_49939_1 [Eumeta japonica]
MRRAGKPATTTQADLGIARLLSGRRTSVADQRSRTLILGVCMRPHGECVDTNTFCSLTIDRRDHRHGECPKRKSTYIALPLCI